MRRKSAMKLRLCRASYRGVGRGGVGVCVGADAGGAAKKFLPVEMTGTRKSESGAEAHAEAGLGGYDDPIGLLAVRRGRVLVLRRGRWRRRARMGVRRR